MKGRKMIILTIIGLSGIIIASGLLNLYSIFDRNYDHKVFTDFAEMDISSHDCELDGDTLKISGKDPWILFNDFPSEIYNIAFDYQKIEGNYPDLKFYFDTGSGFNENQALLTNKTTNIRTNVSDNIVHLRMDFEHAQDNTVLKIKRIEFNSKEGVSTFRKRSLWKYLFRVPIVCVLLVFLCFYDFPKNLSRLQEWFYSVLFFIMSYSLSLRLDEMWMTSLQLKYKLLAFLIFVIMVFLLKMLINHFAVGGNSHEKKNAI